MTVVKAIVMVAAIAVAAVVSQVPTASAAPLLVPPDTLTGEVFLACSTNLFFGGGYGCAGAPTGSTTTTRECDQIGEDRFSFTASGVAFGPYPGTFSETGVVTISRDINAGLQTIVSFESTFTIDSSAGDVTGTKRLALNSPGGLCHNIAPFFAGIAFAELSYSATITTADGRYRDQGTASATVFHAAQGSASNPQILWGFNEVFTSGLLATIPALPVEKQECKDAGWESFGVFRNQGDCVSFITTAGRNSSR